MTGHISYEKDTHCEIKRAYRNDYHFEMTAHVIPIRTEGHPCGGGHIVFLKLNQLFAYIIIKPINKECGKLYDLR